MIVEADIVSRSLWTVSTERRTGHDMYVIPETGITQLLARELVTVETCPGSNLNFATRFS